MRLYFLKLLICVCIFHSSLVLNHVDNRKVDLIFEDSIKLGLVVRNNLGLRSFLNFQTEVTDLIIYAKSTGRA